MEYIIVALFFVSLAAIICFELRWRSVMKKCLMFYSALAIMVGIMPY